MNGGNYCRPEWLGFRNWVKVNIRRPYFFYRCERISRQQLELVQATRLEF